MQQISKGKTHCCSSASNTLKYVKSLIESLPEKINDRIISSSIKDKCAASSDELYLSTGGKKLYVSIKQDEEGKEIIYSTDQLDSIQQELGLSCNEMKKFTYHVRCNFGRKAVPVNYAKNISDRINKLDSFYNEGKFEFDVEKSNVKLIRPVIWANAEASLNTVLEERELIGDFYIVINADGGQGFLKLVMSVFPKNYCNDDDSDDEIFTKKRRLYSESKGCNNKKLTSASKAIILCIVPKVSESYDNLKILIDLTKLNDILFRFVADFKLLLTVNG